MTSSGLLALAGWSCAVALRGYGGLMTNVPSTGAGRTDLGRFFADMFAITGSIRYVAVGCGQDIAMRQRVGVDVASSDVSNRFEELLVNPTLLTWPPSAAISTAAGFVTSSSATGASTHTCCRSQADTCASPSRSIRTPWRAATPFDRPSGASGVGRPYGAGDALSCRWDGWHTVTGDAAFRSVVAAARRLSCSVRWDSHAIAATQHHCPSRPLEGSR